MPGLHGIEKVLLKFPQVDCYFIYFFFSFCQVLFCISKQSYVSISSLDSDICNIFIKGVPLYNHENILFKLAHLPLKSPFCDLAIATAAFL